MMHDPPKRVVLNSDGITSCCGAMTTIDQDSLEEYCKGCYRAVQLRIVKTPEGELLMMAGAQPCGDSMPIPRKRRKKKPRTTARHGRGKGIKR